MALDFTKTMTAEHEVMSAAAMMFLGAAALAMVSFGTVAGNEPTATSPYSLTVVLAVMDRWGPGAYLIWPMVFLVWGIQLFARVPRIPARSAILTCLALVVGASWVLANWRTGVVHPGLGHVALLLALNLLVGAILGGLLVRSRRKPTFAVSYAFHWLLFAWIAWSGLPWLGEGT